MADSLGSAVLTLSVDDQQFQAGMGRAQQLLQRTGQSLQNAFSGNAGRSLTSLNIKLTSLQQELQNVSIGTRRFQELRREIENTERSLRRATGGGGSGPLGNFATALAGLGTGAAIAGFFKQSIQSAIELETITKKLSNTLGEQGAGKALSFTKGLADQLGLSFKTLAGSFSSFTAAASSAGVPLDVQRELFASVSKAAQQLGLSNDELKGSLLALQQVASKGTVQMEELRGQLGERLPIAFGAAAKGLGITQQELIKLVETGRLTSAQFFPALTKGLNQLLSASEGAPTAAQNLGKLGNAWDELQTSFGTDLLPSVTESVKVLTTVIEGLGVKQRADKLGFDTGLAGFLGIIPDRAVDAVASLKLVQREFNLTDKQANALFSDAVADTQKGRFVQNPAFLDPDRLSLVNEKVRQLAQAYRDANPDRADELSKEQAAIEKLRAAAIARSDAELKLIAPSKQRLSDIQAIQGLEGVALDQAKAQLAIDQARAEEKKAIADFDKKIAGAGFDRDNPAVIDAAAKVEAAGNNVRAALIEGGQSVEASIKRAAETLKSAQSGFANQVTQSFDIATDKQRKQARQIFENQINAAQQAGAFDPRRAAAKYGGSFSPGGSMTLNGKTTEFTEVLNLSRLTTEELGKLAAEVSGLQSAEETLAKAVADNSTALKVLAEKNWAVSVQVNADGTSQVYGDAVNGALAT